MTCRDARPSALAASAAAVGRCALEPPRRGPPHRPAPAAGRPGRGRLELARAAGLTEGAALDAASLFRATKPGGRHQPTRVGSVRLSSPGCSSSRPGSWCSSRSRCRCGCRCRWPHSRSCRCRSTCRRPSRCRRRGASSRCCACTSNGRRCRSGFRRSGCTDRPWCRPGCRGPTPRGSARRRGRRGLPGSHGLRSCRPEGRCPQWSSLRTGRRCRPGSRPNRSPDGSRCTPPRSGTRRRSAPRGRPR